MNVGFFCDRMITHRAALRQFLILPWRNRWNIAASNGSDDGVKLRDEVASLMTSAQIAEAQKLARECIRKEYKGC